MKKLFLLKSLLLLCALIVGSGSVWAESIEINTTNSGVTGSYQDKEFTSSPKDGFASGGKGDLESGVTNGNLGRGYDFDDED